MTNNEVVRKIKKIGYHVGKRKRHASVWNCPCENKNHPVYIPNHPSKECRVLNNIKKQLGPHRKDF